MHVMAPVINAQQDAAEQVILRLLRQPVWEAVYVGLFDTVRLEHFEHQDEAA